MKYLKSVSLIIVLISCHFGLAQENSIESEESNMEKVSYYKQRAKEDAKYEQQFKPNSKKEEREFWKEKEAYEKDLKKKDDEAYEAYMQGKRDAYREHYNHCDHHCHHGTFYYRHASYYYHGYYDHHYYNHSPRRSTVSTRVGINSPRIRIGF